MEFQPVSSLCPAAVRQLLRHGEMSEGKLQFAWASAVGPAIVRATTVRLTTDGTLEVIVGAEAWRRELRRSQTGIFRRLQELLGADVVKAMRVVRGTGAGA